MKKLLMILGGIFTFLILISVIGITFAAIKGTSLDKESKAYVDEVTPKILANLNKDTLLQYSSDELKKSATSEDFDKIFKMFTKLGKFQKYGESKGNCKMSYTTWQGKLITAKFKADATFENGPATITITVIKKANQWQVMGFHINSMALIN